MKKSLILMLVGGLLLATSNGVFAEELIPLPEPVESSEVQTEQSLDTSSEGTLETSRLCVYPDEYPEGYRMFQTTAPVNAESAYVMFEKVNALRVSKGLNPLILDSTLTYAAMQRASEICLVYQHVDPAGLWAQPEYKKYSGSGENIVIGRESGLAAYQAFEGSGTHYAQMMQSFLTHVGVGNYGGAWVLVVEVGAGYQGHEMTKSELISTYTTSSRLAKTVVDQNPDDIALNDGFKHNYVTKLLTDGSSSTTKSVKLDKGVSQQLQPIIYPWPYDFTKDYDNLGTKLVPSTLTWVSSSPSIASVDSTGVVTGKTAGTATITGTLYDQSVTYSVTVSNNGTTPTPDLDPNFLVKYRTHVQNVGWQAFVADGSMSGTSGRSLRLEGINIDLNDNISGGIEYRTHVQNIGWQNYVANGAMSGTEGMSYRLEGIQIRLTGEAATKYDIYYHTHTQNIGWMGWAKNGEMSGSAGFSYRLEGIEIKLVPKGGAAPGSTANAFVENK